MAAQLVSRSAVTHALSSPMYRMVNIKSVFSGHSVSRRRKTCVSHEVFGAVAEVHTKCAGAQSWTS